MRWYLFLTELEVLERLCELYQHLGEMGSSKEVIVKTTNKMKEWLLFDAIAIYLLDKKKVFFMKVNSELQEHELSSPNPFDIDLFERHSPLIYEQWLQESKFSQRLIELQNFTSVVLLPWITKDKLQGVVAYATQNRHSFSQQEVVIMKIVSHSLKSIIDCLLYQEFLEKNNEQLKGITKKMRHDFANDIQAIALGLELLSTTELDEEQEKYVKILDKSKTSATKKLLELKKLKKEVEKDYY